jgi:hypothetical protein
LKFDFSTTSRSSNIEEAAQLLRNSINQSLQDFYETYSTYLGEDANKLSRDIILKDPIDNLKDCVRLVKRVLSNRRNKQLAGVHGIHLLVDEYDAVTNDFLEHYNIPYDGSAIERVFKSFWSTIKSMLPATNGIRKAFITGIAPLSFTGLSGGFNAARNLSFHVSVAGLCGLTRADIEAALEKLCDSDIDAYKKHLQDMTTYLNGYHFCNQKTLETIYNTETCLAYFQSLKEGVPPEARDPANSEVSQQFLRKFSASSSAIEDFETGLKRDEKGDFVPFEYNILKQNFTLKDLDRDGRPTWRSLMLYCGGLTFDPKDPAHSLKIPNLIAAERIAEAVLEKYQLRETLSSALKGLDIDGDIQPVLRCYRNLMIQRDVHENDFRKSEETHRDSFYFSLLKNPALRPHAEFQLTKPNRTPGRCDIVLPTRNHLVVMEWKVVPIDFLDILIPKQRSKKGTRATEAPGGRIMQEKKASLLSKYSCNNVLGINFSKKDKFRVGKLEKWIIDEVAPQLKSYIMSEEIKKKLGGRSLKAHVVVVVGSRQILVWDMDDDGELVGEPDLVE